MLAYIQMVPPVTPPPPPGLSIQTDGLLVFTAIFIGIVVLKKYSLRDF
ncbi:hypothetical protein [Polaribacter septentrionalilitoris]|nr:hypothetical protein [Polaribacter septentrionalilitoris]